MNTCEHAQPYGHVPPKRVFAIVPVSIDWHDYLIKRRRPGQTVISGYTIRLERTNNRGYIPLQFRASAGTTGGKETAAIAWPTAPGGIVTDGQVTWTAEALTDASLRTTITGVGTWPAISGLTITDASVDDLVLTALVGAGVSGQTYEVANRPVMANGEQNEGVAVMLVQD